MRYTALLASLACSAALANEPRSLGAYFLYGAESLAEACTGVDNSFACARQIENKLLQKSERATRASQTSLRIKTHKKTMRLDDTPDPEDDRFAGYSYFGLSPKLQLHVVHVQHYEGTSFLLINKAGSQKFYVRGYPVPSPSGSHFLAWDGDEAYGKPGFEVWERIGAQWRKQYSMEAKDFPPKQVKWLNDSQIEWTPECPAEVAAQQVPNCISQRANRTSAGSWRSSP